MSEIMQLISFFYGLNSVGLGGRVSKGQAEVLRLALCTVCRPSSISVSQVTFSGGSPGLSYLAQIHVMQILHSV